MQDQLNNMANTHFFEERQRLFQGLSERFSTISNRFATARVSVFIAGVVLSIYFSNAREGTLTYISVLGAITILVFLIHRHNKIKYKRDHNRFLAQINSDEIHRLKGTIQSFEDGSEFINEEHPYTSDLDIFGRNSVFQLVNRTATIPGKQLLAKWLQNLADFDQIVGRQKAVTKLATQVDWSQQFQASAIHFKNKSADLGPLLRWMDNEDEFSNNKISIIASFILPLISFFAIIGYAILDWSFYWFIFSIIPGGTILIRKLNSVSQASERITNSLSTIRAIHSLILQIKKVSIESTYLEEYRNKLFNNQYNILNEIKHLKLLLQFFEARSNAVYLFLNVLFMGDFHLMRAAEKWRKRNKSNLNNWFEIVGEFESINSLAGTLHTHDDFVMPTITNEFRLKLIAVGHPLINPLERVCNDFAMEGKGKVVIITGSNMSGKSTFLRTLGVNIILAQMGGPVCAKEAGIPYTSVFSGMRIKDNLEEHISSFYAELKRIKQLLDWLKNKELPMFYLLDEILKGTNSKDRHHGSEALIQQLSQTRSFGIVSTHDLSLGNLSEDSDLIVNQNFSSSIEGNEIMFDYKIRPGVCNSFNASKLMEKMGIVGPSKSG